MGFLDNVGKSFSQGVDRAKFAADKLQRQNKIKSEISELQRQIEANEGIFEPLLLEPHPDHPGKFRIVDGDRRKE